MPAPTSKRSVIDSRPLNTSSTRTHNSIKSSSLESPALEKRERLSTLAFVSVASVSVDTVTLRLLVPSCLIVASFATITAAPPTTVQSPNASKSSIVFTSWATSATVMPSGGGSMPQFVTTSATLILRPSPPPETKSWSGCVFPGGIRVSVKRSPFSPVRILTPFL